MKKIIIILSLFFTIFSFTPSLFEIIQANNILPDRIFVLEHNYMFDYNFYLSRIREGQEGRWTVVEKYYNQPHAGSLFQIFYLAAGKIGGFIGLTPPFVYHTLRIILGCILLILIGLYAGNFLSGWWAILAYLFVATAGSWPILVKAGEYYRFATYMGYWSAVDSLQRITFLPHVLLGQIFILLFIWVFGSREKQQLNLQRLLFWGIIGLIVGIIFPPTLIVVYTVFAVISLFELWDLKTLKIGKIKLWFKKSAVPRLFFILLSIPSFLYLQTMFKIWPWKALALFDVLHRMPLQYKEYFMALGPVLPIGLIGMVVAIIKRENKLFPVVSWVISVFLLFAVFEKVPTQSPLRFTEALIHIPLGILTAYLFFFCWNQLTKLQLQHKFGRLVVVKVVIAGLILGILLMGLGVMVSMVGWLTDQGKAKLAATWVVPIGAQLSYPLKDFMDSIYYLRDNTKIDDVVLTYITAGNFIPAYTGNFVYIGHANTPNEDEKEKIAARFFAGKMSKEEAKEFLQKERISYIFYGPQEKELGNINNLTSVYGFITPIYNNSKVTIYK